MSFYTEYVTLSPVPSGWCLTSILKWEIGKLGSGLFFDVAPGFISDLATIPIWARPFFNPADPLFAKAAILHDAMLADPDFSRVTAAAEFFEALRADRVSEWRAMIMGLAVLTRVRAKH